MTEEKIKVPAHVLGEQEQAAARAGSLDEMRLWLEGRHREALEENPYGGFKFRTPLDTLKKLTAEERGELQRHEETTFKRLQPLARGKQEQKRAFVSAGGSAERFEQHWQREGEDAHLFRVAAENVERARRDSSVY